MSQLVHNPRCSKSREALKILTDKNIDVEIIEYLKNPMDEKKILSILKSLPDDGAFFIRKKEQEFKDLGLKNKELSLNDWATLLAKHPKLIERPIYIKNSKAIVGRPPEEVLKIL